MDIKEATEYLACSTFNTGSQLALAVEAVTKDNERLQSIIDQLRWTPCSEAMPPEGEDVLLRSPEYASSVTYFEEGSYCDPTEEWHPLPGTALWESIMEGKADE